jgi:hypothetical protein
MFAVKLGECAARGEAGQLLKQETPLAAAAQAKLADELFVSRFAAGGTGDALD